MFEPNLVRLRPGTCFVAVLLMLICSTTNGQPVRDKILEDVSIEQVDGHYLVDVKFSFRFRYQSHFPTDSGSELRIRLQPVRVATADVDAIFKRESVVPHHADVVALDEVTYEGDIESGTQLTLTFTKNVSYEVIPDPDYTHIRILILSIN